jgi:hypothetical protein
MAQRKVFGRIQVVVGEETYRIELRPDGLHVRLKHHRKEWVFTPEQIARLSKHQTELFTHSETISRQQIKPMPCVPQGQLVPPVP